VLQAPLPVRGRPQPKPTAGPSCGAALSSALLLVAQAARSPRLPQAAVSRSPEVAVQDARGRQSRGQPPDDVCPPGVHHRDRRAPVAVQTRSTSLLAARKGGRSAGLKRCASRHESRSRVTSGTSWSWSSDGCGWGSPEPEIDSVSGPMLSVGRYRLPEHTIGVLAELRLRGSDGPGRAVRHTQRVPGLSQCFVP
jgi:hypothetical protein